MGRPLQHPDIKIRKKVFTMGKPDKGSNTEQEFRRLKSDILLSMYDNPSAHRMDRLAAMCILNERNYNLSDPFIKQ